jgi:hypothetical protein
MKITVHEHKVSESSNPISQIYGDGGIYTDESSADGFYPDDSDTLAWAIYNNDVETIKKLHDGNLKTYDEPDDIQVVGGTITTTSTMILPIIGIMIGIGIMTKHL